MLWRDDHNITWINEDASANGTLHESCSSAAKRTISLRKDNNIIFSVFKKTHVNKKRWPSHVIHNDNIKYEHT